MKLWNWLIELEVQQLARDRDLLSLYRLDSPHSGPKEVSPRQLGLAIGRAYCARLASFPPLAGNFPSDKLCLPGGKNTHLARGPGTDVSTTVNGAETELEIFICKKCSVLDF